MKERVKFPEQDAKVRAKNFEEVTQNYTEENAVEEAGRCLGCKNPKCVESCPVSVGIPEFIGKIKIKDFAGAYDIIAATNALPAVCGRVCPQESQCEGACVLGNKGQPIAIGQLERYVADLTLENTNNSEFCILNSELQRPKGVAVVGAGPAGLTCAGALAAKGVPVTIFEALHVAGGVLVYGIPEFRLPKSVVRAEIARLTALGVVINTDVIIGKTITIDELLREYGAVFVGSGAGLPSFLGIPGESLVGVFSANEYLTRVNLMKAYRDDHDTPVTAGKNVAVIGGGNVAMDAARVALRLGAASVSIIYRRSFEEMPARKAEVHHAIEEGIIFRNLTNPIEIIADENGRAKTLRCNEMTLGEPDASGRRKPVPVPGSVVDIDADVVILAIGTSPNPLIISTTGELRANKWGCIEADEATGKTTKDGVWAGGDIVTGAATVILAMGAGKRAAEDIFCLMAKYN